jgi:lipopolysaccharide heptosyltransferase I
MKLLVIKLGALGDVINTLPLIINIKQSLNAEIHWLVAPLSYPLVKEHTSVDKVILFDKQNLKESLTTTIKEIRQTRYDIVLDLQRLLKSGFFCMVARTGRRIGFDRKRCKEMSWIFPFERIPHKDSNAHMLNQYMEFAKYLDIKNDAPGKVAWDIPWTNDAGQVNKYFTSDYIVLNIGATKPANRWCPENFAKLADMIKEKTNCKPVITGGKEDKTYSEKIQANACCDIQDMCGKTSLKELTVMIAGAKCVVSCDTGPMHLAVALGTDLIALFGPSNPDRTGPYKGTIIQQKLKCAPCNKKECDNPVCMEKIKPERVMTELIQKIQD